MIEHPVKPLGGYVPRCLAVDGLAEPHIVGGNGLCDGAARSARVAELARDFLADANFGQCAISRQGQIDCARLLRRGE